MKSVYFYITHPDALEEMRKITGEMEKCFKEKKFFATIVLCGAINERILSEKLIGHSKVRVSTSDKWQPGWEFYIENKTIFSLLSKKPKVELVRKTDVDLYDGQSIFHLKWGEIQTLFDIDFSFEKKVELTKKINIGETEREKIRKIHDLRVKYFHPFKLPSFDAKLKKDAEDAVKLTKELLNVFYEYPV